MTRLLTNRGAGLDRTVSWFILFLSGWVSHGGAEVQTQTPSGGTFFGAVPDERVTRHYYIAAEPVVWNFIPLRKDPICSNTGAAEQMVIPPRLLEQDGWLKARYFQYTDDRFAVRAVQPERLGILGPVLRGAVGEFLAVTFLNRTDRPLSIHPHGVLYDKESEGASYLPTTGGGGVVPPAGRFTYIWKLDQSAGPGSGEPSSKAWLYHSHVSTEEEINLGLVGFIIVTDPQRARPDGTPSDVDREMPVFLKTYDASVGDDDEENLPLPAGKEIPREQRMQRLAQSVQALKRREMGERHAVNGLSFANLQGLEMRQNERVRWYLFSLGSERDMHSAHWHGTRILENGIRRTDTVELMPGSMKTADMVADNPGTWLFQCHVGEHMSQGMFCTYQVLPTNGSARSSSPAFFSVPTESIQITSLEEMEERSERKLAIKGNVSMTYLPKFENRRVQVEFDGVSRVFQLDANGAGRQNGDRILLRIVRAGKGICGVQLGIELEFDTGFRKESVSSPARLVVKLNDEVFTSQVLRPGAGG